MSSRESRSGNLAVLLLVGVAIVAISTAVTRLVQLRLARRRTLARLEPRGRTALCHDREQAHRPRIVCLCGSTRFGEAFREANLSETLAGRIVLTVGCDMRSDAELFAELSGEELDQVKAALDELHLRKIDLADEILVLNVGGHVGSSTSREIEYARATGKTIRWLEASVSTG